MKFAKLELGSTSLVGGKDLKTLKRYLAEHLTRSDQQLQLLLPPKAQIRCAKITNTKSILYTCENEPLFISLQNGSFMPTLYCLFKLPEMLPTMLVPPPVSVFIIKGADLMVPGVINYSPAFKSGLMAAVAVVGNPYPFAIGICQEPLDESGNLKTTGKALQILHVYNDALWKHGPRNLPNSGFKTDRIEAIDISEPSQELDRPDETVAEQPENSSSGPASVDEIKQQLSEVELDSSATETPTFVPSTQLCDFMLNFCFKQVIHDINDAQQLPLESSALYSKMLDEAARLITSKKFHKVLQGNFTLGLVKCNTAVDLMDPGITTCSVQTLLSLKNSSFKKLNKWLQHMESLNYLLTKECRGTVSIVSINRQNEELAQFTSIAVASENKDCTPEKSKVRVQRFISPSQEQIAQFTQLGVPVEKGQLFTYQDFCSLCRKHLAKDSGVCLFVKSPPDDVATAINAQVAKAQEHHQITFPDSSSGPIRKGPCEKICISREQRGNRKSQTVVKGLAPFIPELESLPATLQKKFACSVTLTDSTLVLQGNIDIKRYLVDVCGIPGNYITG